MEQSLPALKTALCFTEEKTEGLNSKETKCQNPTLLYDDTLVLSISRGNLIGYSLLWEKSQGISYLGQDFVNDGNKRTRLGPEAWESRTLRLRPLHGEPESTGDVCLFLSQSTPHKCAPSKISETVSYWDESWPSSNMYRASLGFILIHQPREVRNKAICLCLRPQQIWSVRTVLLFTWK